MFGVENTILLFTLLLARKVLLPTQENLLLGLKLLQTVPSSLFRSSDVLFSTKRIIPTRTVDTTVHV